VRRSLPTFGVVLLALVTLGWGFVWPVNKFVIAEVPPLTFRAICVLGGGLGLLVVARAGGQSLRVPVRLWPQVAALSACNVVGWNVLVIYGIALLPSGRAALIGYTMPLWSTLLAVWVLGERLTARRAASLVLGMAGVGVLLGGDAMRMVGAAAGVGLVLTAAIGWGLGTVLLKRFALPVPTSTLTAWMMLSGGAPIAVAAAVLERDRWHPVSTAAALGLAYCVVVAFMFCYWAWNRLVLMLPVAVVAVSSLATPVIGVASGLWLLGEPVTWRELAAAGCILGAIALVIAPGPRAPATDTAAGTWRPGTPPSARA
jgi:drug/metabolite transporter (DMT)-like permease